MGGKKNKSKMPLSADSPEGKVFIREVRDGATALYQSVLGLSEADAKKRANKVVKIIERHQRELIAI